MVEGQGHICGTYLMPMIQQIISGDHTYTCQHNKTISTLSCILLLVNLLNFLVYL
jgi:hypothetical protein